MRPLLRDDAPRPLRIACLEELGQKKVAPPDKLELVAGALLKHAEGDDETLAGLSLLALRMVTDRKDKKYNAEQWKTFIARRAFEFRMRREAKEVFAKLKKEYAEGKDDPDRVDEIVKAVYDAGRFLQNKAIPGANQDVKEALQDLRDEMKRFHDKIKGK